MPNLNLDIYLVDENGEYILDENDNKIVIDTLDIPFSYGGTRAVSGRRCNGVKSFDVVKTEDHKWRTTVNKSKLMGLFDSGEMAVGALIGAFISSGASSLDRIIAAMQDQLSRGASTLDSDTPAPTPSGDVFSMTVLAPGGFANGTLVSVTGGSWISETFGASGIDPGTLQAAGTNFSFRPTAPDQTLSAAAAEKDWTIVVDGTSFDIPSSVITWTGSNLVINHTSLVTFMMSGDRTNPYIVGGILLKDADPNDVTFLDAVDWFKVETGSAREWTYPQQPTFKKDEQVGGWMIFHGDKAAATDPQFLADYQAFANANLPAGYAPLGLGEAYNPNLPASATPEVITLRANGWYNFPQYTEMDYPALVDHCVSEMGLNSYDDWGGMHINIDIEHGFVGYQILSSTEVRPNTNRAPLYYDADNPSSIYNIDIEAWNNSQKLNGQFIKLAELVRQGAVAAGASSPPLISWYNAPSMADRIQVTDGQIDGRTRVYPETDLTQPGAPDIRANTAWEDLPENLKQEVARRCAVQNYQLYQGGVVDGVSYPPLDILQMLSFQMRQEGDPVDAGRRNNQVSQSTYLAQAFKNLADSGTSLPPREVLGQLTINGKASSPNSDSWLTDATLDFYTNNFSSLDVSSFQWVIFNYPKYWSSVFNMEKANWSEFNDIEKERAEHFWEHVVVPWGQEGYTFPGDLGTAELTLSQSNFVNNPTRRQQWWTVWADYIGTRYGLRSAAACIE